MEIKKGFLAAVICLTVLYGCGTMEYGGCGSDSACADDEQCIDGACQKIENGNFEITLATLKKNYTIGEQVRLTDPPTDPAREFRGYIIEFDEKPLLAKLRDVQITGMATGSARSNIISQHTSLKNAIQKVIGKDLSTINLEEFINVYNGISLDITESEAKIIERVPGVKAVHENVKVKALLTDSAELVSADTVWDLGYDGSGVDIAVIDTGIDYTHPALGGCLGAGCKVAGGYDLVNDDNDPMDDNGHGTHVAAIAAGNGGGIKGIAPGATIYSYKVLNKNSEGYWSWILSGMDKAMDPNGDGDPSDHADIISMSLGSLGGNPDDIPSKAVDICVDTGAVVVVAAGNSGPNEQTITTPGTARKAITVGASCKPSDIGTYCTEAVAPFSSRGPVIYNGVTLNKPDVLAPGTNICSAQLPNYLGEGSCGNKLIEVSGTSMATPHVSGAAALLLQAHPDWTPADIKTALVSTATDMGLSSSKEGAGVINISKALTLGTAPPTVSISTTEMAETADIIGTATGEGFKKYTLYYSTGDAPNNWIKLTESENEVSDGALYNDFDPSKLTYGTNLLKLIGENDLGQTTEIISEVITLMPKSKIDNNLATAQKGRISVELQKKMNGMWVSERVMIDGYEVEIPAQGYFALDTTWDRLGGYIADERGNFRVYAEFKNTRGALLASGSFEFTVV